MRNKGFTLIELLAVIVILAIIALIATPIVLGIIEDSRESSNDITADYVIEGLEKAYSMAFALNSGALPTLEQVKEKFDMKNAEWTTIEGKDVIKATSGLVCNVAFANNELSISCPVSDNKTKNSETMEVASSTSTPEAQGN